MIVVEPRSLPLPDVPDDPRRTRSAPSSRSSSGSGCPASAHDPHRRRARTPRRTPGARGRHHARPGPRLPRLGRQVHDAESPELRPLELDAGRPRACIRRCSRLTCRCVTAAETSERGGACALLGACAAERHRVDERRRSRSSPRPSHRPVSSRAGSRPRSRAAPRDRRLTRARPSPPQRPLSRLPVAGSAMAALRRSPVRRIVNALPSVLRAHVLQGIGRSLAATTVLAGPPAVSHAEALLRGISLRGIPLDGPSTRSSCRSPGARCTSRASP